MRVDMKGWLDEKILNCKMKEKKVEDGHCHRTESILNAQFI